VQPAPGVIVELVAGGLDPARLGSEDLAAPHLLDSEVTSLLTTDARLANAPGVLCVVQLL